MGGLIKCEPNPERDEGFARDVEEYMNYAQEHGLVGQWCVCALSQHHAPIPNYHRVDKSTFVAVCNSLHPAIASAAKRVYELYTNPRRGATVCVGPTNDATPLDKDLFVRYNPAVANPKDKTQFFINV